MLQFISDKIDRLDKFLSTQIKDVSRGKIQKAIKDGQVYVNGKKIIETDFKIHENDKIELPEFLEEKLVASSFELEVVFENNDLAVIDKPAGLVVHPAAGHKNDTLANALLSRFPRIEKVGDPHRPGIVHRLDEDTSGLIVVAKNQTTFEYLKNLFQTRNIQKEYLTLVHGRLPAVHGVIDLPIGKNSTHQKMRVGIGRDAVTEYSVIAESKFNNDPSTTSDLLSDSVQGQVRGKEGLQERGLDQYSLLRVKLHTGRTHQIRVHLASLGNPVFGDQLYGGNFKIPDSQKIDRQFLHACDLKFKLQDGTRLDLSSELPEELKEVLLKIGINLKH